MVIGAVPIIMLLRQKTKGAALRAQLLELINDQLGLLAALVGTVLVQFGFHFADPIAAIVVATIIGVNGVSLFKENLSYLLGRSPGAEFMKNVETTVRATPGVKGLHRLRGQQVGPEAVQLDMHVEVARGLPIEDALKFHKAKPLSRQLEIETYTWDVLPENLKTGNIVDYVCRELEWVRDQLV